MSKKSIRKIIVTISVLSLLLLLGGYYAYTKFATKSEPQTYIQNSANFTIYTPADARIGNIIPDSIANSGAVLSFSISLPDNTTATITEQTVPSDFSAATYFYNQAATATDFTYGKYYDVSITNQPRYMIITNDSALLFATGTVGAAPAALEAAIINLTPQESR